MNPYLTKDNQPTETLDYTLDYYGITLDEFKAMSDEQVVAMVKKFSDVLNDGRIQKSRTAIRHNKGYVGSQNIAFTQSRPEWKEDYGIGDTGSFSRYFDLDKWFEGKLKELPKSVQKTFPFLIVPKASKKERDKNLDIKHKRSEDYGEGFNSEALLRNNHPTCKPLKLMSYLIILGSREGDTVLDPFLGSGTTALACQLLGRECIGIEINPDYCEIAEARLSQLDMVLV